jgi:hypothetical protein
VLNVTWCRPPLACTGTGYMLAMWLAHCAVLLCTGPVAGANIASVMWSCLFAVGSALCSGPYAVAFASFGETVLLFAVVQFCPVVAQLCQWWPGPVSMLH